MGKYKKYAKIEKNSDQSNKISSNNSSNNNYNQNYKMMNKNSEINNKNELYNLRNRNYLKRDENSFTNVLWEIFDAMKYFFIMCKNFIVPTGITFKIFISFLILEILYQGIIIYIIKTVLFSSNKYFSIWKAFTNMYIYVMSYIQMFYIFLCEGLLIFRFINTKIYIFKKLNWLINILTCIIIILNTAAIKELNSKVYKFNVNNNDLHLYNKNQYKEGLVKEYINLYVNKNDDFENYEVCYEIKNNPILYDKINNKKISNYQWNFDNNLNAYIGCKNFSFPKNEDHKPNIYFNCQNKVDTNNASNFCVSSKYRRKRFYSHLKIAILEIIILLLWNLYNYISIRLIYHYYPFLKDENNSQNNLINNKNYNNNLYKKNNQTVTYRDINDEEIYDGNNTDEEDEYEDEEENINKNEEYQKENNIRGFKRRKISKKKMKTYKKRRKNRYKEEINKNKYFDEEILSKEYYDNNEDNNDDDSDKNDNEEDEYYFKINKKSNEANNGEDEEKDESDNDEEDEEEEDDSQDFIARKDKIEEFRKIYLKKIKEHQYLEKAYDHLFGKYVNWIKNKIHQILIESDKNINEEE